MPGGSEIANESCHDIEVVLASFPRQNSHSSYGAIIWINNLSKKQLNMLKPLQKKAIRIVHGTKYNSHTNELFQKSRITKVENIFNKQSPY